MGPSRSGHELFAERGNYKAKKGVGRVKPWENEPW